MNIPSLLNPPPKRPALSSLVHSFAPIVFNDQWSEWFDPPLATRFTSELTTCLRALELIQREGEVSFRNLGEEKAFLSARATVKIDIDQIGAWTPAQTGTDPESTSPAENLGEMIGWLGSAIEHLARAVHVNPGRLALPPPAVRRTRQLQPRNSSPELPSHTSNAPEHSAEQAEALRRLQEMVQAIRFAPESLLNQLGQWIAPPGESRSAPLILNKIGEAIARLRSRASRDLASTSHFTPDPSGLNSAICEVNKSIEYILSWTAYSMKNRYEITDEIPEMVKPYPSKAVREGRVAKRVNEVGHHFGEMSARRANIYGLL